MTFHADIFDSFILTLLPPDVRQHKFGKIILIRASL